MFSSVHPVKKCLDIAIVDKSALIPLNTKKNIIEISSHTHDKKLRQTKKAKNKKNVIIVR